MNIQTHALNNSHTHLLVTNQRFFRFPKHYHETYSVAILTDGAKDFRTPSVQCTLDDSNFVTMNPCEIHSGDAITQDGWKQVVLLFDSESPKIFANENNAKQLVFNNTLRSNKRLRSDLLTACSDVVSSDTELEKEHSFETIMGLLFANENIIDNRVHKNIHGIKRCIEMMSDSPYDKHDLNTLAKTANMSKFHFIRSFKDATGTTPHAYLNMLRVERARRMILNSEMTIADIATECGFADQAHFTRAYKKIYDTPPGSIIRK